MTGPLFVSYFKRSSVDLFIFLFFPVKCVLVTGNKVIETNNRCFTNDHNLSKPYTTHFCNPHQKQGYKGFHTYNNKRLHSSVYFRVSPTKGDVFSTVTIYGVCFQFPFQFFLLLSFGESLRLYHLE